MSSDFLKRNYQLPDPIWKPSLIPTTRLRSKISRSGCTKPNAFAPTGQTFTPMTPLRVFLFSQKDRTGGHTPSVETVADVDEG